MNPDCQRSCTEIELALESGCEPATWAHDHGASCPECRALEALWDEQIQACLSEPLALANSQALADFLQREAELLLAQSSPSSSSPDPSKSTNKVIRWRRFTAPILVPSLLAAAAALTLLIWLSFRDNPAPAIDTAALSKQVTTTTPVLEPTSSATELSNPRLPVTGLPHPSPTLVDLAEGRDLPENLASASRTRSEPLLALGAALHPLLGELNLDPASSGALSTPESLRNSLAPLAPTFAEPSSCVQTLYQSFNRLARIDHHSP